MTGKFKALGLALSVAFAMSALMASVASAEVGATFSSEAEHTTLHVVSNATQEFKAPKVSEEPITCTELEVDATVEGTSVEEVTAVPTYSNCQAIGLSATVTFTECDYTFTANTTTPGREHAPAHINCPEGQQIHIEVKIFGSYFQCVTIGSQTVDGVHYNEVGEHIELEPTVAGIHYQSTGVCGSETGTDGTYKGNATIGGTEGTTANPVAIAWTEGTE